MSSRQRDLFEDQLPPWEQDAGSEVPSATIVLSEAPWGPFSYRIPDRFAGSLQPGMRVVVPLGKSNRPVLGYCMAIEVAKVAPASLKEVTKLVDDQPLCDGPLLKLIEWMSVYYLVPLGQVFEAVVPAGVRAAAGTREKSVWRLTDSGKALAEGRSSPDDKGSAAEDAGAEDSSSELGEDALKKPAAKLTAKQRGLVEILHGHPEGLLQDDLLQQASCSIAPLQALRGRGLVEVRGERRMESGGAAGARPVSHPRTAPQALSADQRLALRAIEEAMESRQSQTILLHGVTGSGKTEVYMQAIQKTIAMRRQAIVLVPEISLTPQTRHRFQSRFDTVAVLHSHMSDVERHQQWRRIASGQADVVIGPRSALFAPVPHLGLIVVDEEHESSFKQETVPRYHARDVALHRAHLLRIPLVLGSATPSLESWQRVRSGAYKLVSLPRRIHNRPLPHVDVVDLRDPRDRQGQGSISGPLHREIEQTLQQKGQVILLLNRRGFATSIQCPHCGYVVPCPECDLPLTHHQDGGKAVCHYCEYTIATPNQCPQCKHAGIRYWGTGTQRLEIEVREKYPQATIARMDSDTMRKPGSHERTLAEFREGKVDLLLGTQMIAKGLDFPNVLLVGVIHADSALHFPDFRAAERTFQLVTQVAGRTGRGEKPGTVVVQTYSPDHPAIMAASKHDFQSFAEQELEHRERFGYPPFGSMARIIVRGPDMEATDAFSKTVARKLKSLQETIAPECRILGPAPPPFAKLRGKYRFHILLCCPHAEPLHRMLVPIDRELAPPGEIQLLIDVDPIDML